MVIGSCGTVGIIEDSVCIMTPVIVDVNVNCMWSIVVHAISKSIGAFIMNIYEIVAGNGDGRSTRFAGVT